MPRSQAPATTPRPAHRQEGDLRRGRIAVALVPVGAVVAISGLAVAY